MLVSFGMVGGALSPTPQTAPLYQSYFKMENPIYNEINDKLNRIEQMAVLAAKDAFTMSDAAFFTGLSKAYLYKLVHQRKIPFYKSAGGKQTYFAKSELTQWLLKHRVSTIEEAEQAAAAYVVNNPRNGRKGGAK